MKMRRNVRKRSNEELKEYNKKNQNVKNLTVAQ